MSGDFGEPDPYDSVEVVMSWRQPREDVWTLRRKYASQFDVPDGGQFSNDWATRIDAVLARLEQTERELREYEEFIAFYGYTQSCQRWRMQHAALASTEGEERDPFRTPKMEWDTGEPYVEGEER